MLTLYDSLDIIDVESVVGYVVGLQQSDGSFAGDEWGKWVWVGGVSRGVMWAGWVGG